MRKKAGGGKDERAALLWLKHTATHPKAEMSIATFKGFDIVKTTL